MRGNPGATACGTSLKCDSGLSTGLTVLDGRGNVGIPADDVHDDVGGVAGEVLDLDGAVRSGPGHDEVRAVEVQPVSMRPRGVHFSMSADTIQV